jgi:hypothetical protein
MEGGSHFTSTMLFSAPRVRVRVRDRVRVRVRVVVVGSISG